MRKNKNKQAGIGGVAAKEKKIEGECAGMSTAVVIQGHNLHSLLTLIHRGIESAKQVDGGFSCLPPKLWLKQQFCIGMNEVTRTLERMPPHSTSNPISSIHLQLQAVIVAADCNPKWMTKHIHSLASTRDVPLILLLKDQLNNNNNTCSSFKLGQLLNLKTATAIGIKAKGNAINQIIDQIIHSKDLNLDDRLQLLQHKTSS